MSAEIYLEKEDPRKNISAKINVETEDPALAAMLGIVIAKALRQAEFSNVLVKNVAIKNPSTYPGWNKVNVVLEQITPERPLTNHGERLPPELGLLYWVIPSSDNDFLSAIGKRNPALMDAPVVLSFHPDTTEEYEKNVDSFLKTGVTKVRL